MLKAALLVLGLVAVIVAANYKPPQTYRIQLHQHADGRCDLLLNRYGQIYKDALETPIMEIKAQTHEHSHIAHDDDHDEDEDDATRTNGHIVDVYAPTQEQAWNHLISRRVCRGHINDLTEMLEAKVETADEIRQLVNSGPSSNRIDIVLMGDGYVQADRDRFFADMQRLTDDMFASTTFNSHLPLFNIWAIFRPSVQRGIGVGSRPLNTAFGLYRDGTELRGIYCSKPNDARTACRQLGADACDYPSLIGNDEYYGGLGGEFTISTRSETSGTMVLRHELGHNLINVGEEYDGGQAYFGVNFAVFTSSAGWKHWLTEPNNLNPQQGVLLSQQHAWYDLARGAFTVTFTSTGQYDRWTLIFSASGVENPGSLRVLLDGQPLPWNTTSTLDRTFWTYEGRPGFTRGQHTLRWEQVTAPVGHIRQLCNFDLWETKLPPAFHNDPSYIGFYPVYRLGGIFTGYRPNDERCLMRNMSSPDFCVVCLEGMWTNLLNKMSLIDGVKVDSNSTHAIVTLNAVPLAQLRQVPKPAEKYTVTWAQGSTARPEHNDKFTFAVPLNTGRGSWRVTLKFTTPEVRADPQNRLTDTATFTV